jgi:hypothetical protein
MGLVCWIANTVVSDATAKKYRGLLRPVLYASLKGGSASSYDECASFKDLRRMTNNRKFIITSLSLMIAITFRVQAFWLYTCFLLPPQFIEMLQKTIFRKLFQHCRATFCFECSKMLQNQSRSETSNVVKIRQT